MGTPAEDKAAAEAEAAKARQTEADLLAANGRADDLQAKLDALTAASETRAAAAEAEAAKAKQALEDFQTKMKGGKTAKVGKDGLVEVRVKTPMLINPIAADFPNLKDGEVMPGAYSLTAGLNYVPSWVADNWAVKANAVDEPEA